MSLSTACAFFHRNLYQIIKNSFYSLYTFDMRALDTPVMVHMDHVSAVLDVDYSPTGREFVSASFDKSIRIFPVDKSRSRYVTTSKHLFLFDFFFPALNIMSVSKGYLVDREAWWTLVHGVAKSLIRLSD